MRTFESKLTKKEFFERISELNIEHVLVLRERYEGGERETPVGFIVDGVKIMLSISHWSSVWVNLGFDSRDHKKAERIIGRLQLNPTESYLLVVNYPSEEIMKVWGKKQS